MMDLRTQRDTLERELDEGWDWLDRAKARREWMADPRNRQKYNKVEDRLLAKLDRYTATCDALNVPEQEELWEVGA